MATWDELSARIADALGIQKGDVPRPGTEAFMDMIARLEETDPGLAREAVSALASGVEPPRTVVEMKRESVRTGILAAMLRSLGFLKRDATQPHRFRVNRTVVFLIGGGLVMILLLAFQLMQPAPRKAARPQAHRQPVAERAQEAPRSAPAPSAPTLPQERQQAAGGQQQAAKPTGQQQQGGQGQAQASAPAPIIPPLPTVPPAGPATPPPPVTQGSVPSQSTTILAMPSGQGNQQQASASGTRIVDGESAEPAKTAVVTPTAEGGQQAAGQGQPSPQGGAAAAGGGTTIVAPQQPQEQGGGGQAGPSQPQQPKAQAPRLKVGDQFTVTLQAPLAISQNWQSVPAIAVATSGPLQGWRVVGQASLAQDGTPQITWTQALSPDGTSSIAIHGVAYNPATGVPGVTGAKSSVMTPQVARTVLSGTLAAISQYVQAQLAAQQTQVSGLTATITSQVPPFWQFVASQLATGFQPGPVQNGGTVVVAQIPAGTQITVFITQES